MTEPMSDETRSLFFEFLKDDPHAIKFCIDLIFVGHLWDDLVDQDRKRSIDEINAAFLTLLAEHHLNPFYQRFALQVDPIIANVASLWLISTKLEKGNDNDKLTAFVIRNALIEVVNYCGMLLGGVAWVIEKGPALWQTFNLLDKYREFLNE